VVAVSLIDWIGRSSLASYTTGFLTMYVLGVLIAASEPASAVPGSLPGFSVSPSTNRGDL
jgi:hypothetical protein